MDERPKIQALIKTSDDALEQIPKDLLANIQPGNMLDIANKGNASSPSSLWGLVCGSIGLAIGFTVGATITTLMPPLLVASVLAVAGLVGGTAAGVQISRPKSVRTQWERLNAGRIEVHVTETEVSIAKNKVEKSVLDIDLARNELSKEEFEEKRRRLMERTSKDDENEETGATTQIVQHRNKI